MAPPVVAKSFGGTVKVHNPRMFNSKYEEVTPFLSEIHRIIEFNAVSFSTDHHKVLYVGLYLKDGIPIEWFNHLEQFKSPLLYDWSGFVQEFTTKFADPHLILSADQKLDRLKQTGLAHFYLTRFIELSLHLDMTEQTKISHFMKGLKPAIKDNLVSIVDRPKTLLGWEHIIIQVDTNLHQRDIEHRDEPAKKSTFHKTSNNPNSTMPNTTNTDVISIDVDAVTVGAPHGKLTPAERAERIDKKLCLYCSKPGHVVDACLACKAKHGDTTKLEKAQPKKN